MALSETEISRLQAAMHSLGSERSCIPWNSIASLAAIGRGGMQLTVDFRATELIGAPVLIASSKWSFPCFSLTRRQQEVLALIVEAKSNKEIARQLGIKLSTVKDHVHDILECTGCRSRAELIAGKTSLAT